MDFHDKIRQEQAEQILRVASATGQDSAIGKAMSDEIEKGGKPAVIGEIRKFGGKDCIKTVDGWKYVGKGTGTKAKEHTAKHSTGKKEESKESTQAVEVNEKTKEEFVGHLGEFVGANEYLDIDKYANFIKPYIREYTVYRYWSDPNVIKGRKYYSTTESLSAFDDMVQEGLIDDGIITVHYGKGFDPYRVLSDYKKYAGKEQSFIESTIVRNQYQKEIVFLDKINITEQNTIGKLLVDDEKVVIDKSKLRNWTNSNK